MNINDSHLLVAGPIRFYHGRQMVPREFVILSEASGGDESLAGKVLPVYPATEGLSHKMIRSLIDRHLTELIGLTRDLLPEPVRRSLDLPGLARDEERFDELMAVFLQDEDQSLVQRAAFECEQASLEIEARRQEDGLVRGCGDALVFGVGEGGEDVWRDDRAARVVGV